MAYCGLRRLVVILAFMMLAWQEPMSPLPSNGGLLDETPGKNMCITCEDGVAHKEIQRITVEELKQEIDRGADIVILDARPIAVYNKGHIKGALSLPWSTQLPEGNVKQLPRDKTIVTYCDCGPGEADGADLAAQLKEIGFGNVKVLADPSIRGWMKAGYPAEK